MQARKKTGIKKIDFIVKIGFGFCCVSIVEAATFSCTNRVGKDCRGLKKTCKEIDSLAGVFSNRVPKMTCYVFLTFEALPEAFFTTPAVSFPDGFVGKAPFTASRT